MVDYGESSPALPLGHPFTSVQSSFYWSSSSSVSGPSSAWYVSMVSGSNLVNNKAGSAFVWPVRGGQ